MRQSASNITRHATSGISPSKSAIEIPYGKCKNIGIANRRKAASRRQRGFYNQIHEENHQHIQTREGQQPAPSAIVRNLPSQGRSDQRCSARNSKQENTDAVLPIAAKYGYCVVDLGRDVDPQTVVDAAKEQNIRLVGLSALMTTTVKSMEKTIELLREQVPDVKTFVGGAVLTPEYAETMGATWYAKDAAESARIAERFFNEQ